MRIALIIFSTAIGLSGPAAADDDDQMRRLNPLLPSQTMPAPGAQVIDIATEPPAPTDIFLSGELEISLEIALTRRWGIAGSLDWQRSQALASEDVTGAADTIFASGQISFEF